MVNYVGFAGKYELFAITGDLKRHALCVIYPEFVNRMTFSICNSAYSATTFTAYTIAEHNFFVGQRFVRILGRIEGSTSVSRFIDHQHTHVSHVLAVDQVSNTRWIDALPMSRCSTTFHPRSVFLGWFLICIQMFVHICCHQDICGARCPGNLNCIASFSYSYSCLPLCIYILLNAWTFLIMSSHREKKRR